MKQEDIIKFIKSQRLRWAAHVMKMENTRTKDPPTVVESIEEELFKLRM